MAEPGRVATAECVQERSLDRASMFLRRMTQLPPPKKIVLHCPRGYRVELDALVAAWIEEGVNYVGVVGVDASKVEDIIDELCVGDGSSAYEMLTAAHEPNETLEDALRLANQLTGKFAGVVRVVVL